jgi:hypothetical protein
VWRRRGRNVRNRCRRRLLWRRSETRHLAAHSVEESIFVLPESGDARCSRLRALRQHREHTLSSVDGVQLEDPAPLFLVQELMVFMGEPPGHIHVAWGSFGHLVPAAGVTTSATRCNRATPCCRHLLGRGSSSWVVYHTPVVLPERLVHLTAKDRLFITVWLSMGGQYP